MNKKIIGVVVLVVIVLGGLMYFRNSPGNFLLPIGSEMMEKNQMMSARDIFESGKDEQCSFGQNDDLSQSSGTVYFSKGMMRGDFDVVSGGQNMRSHMVSDGDYIYNWSSVGSQGIKMRIVGSESTGASGTNKQGFDLNQKVGYRCSPWNADRSKFEVPSNIQFIDPTTMMQGSGTIKSGVMEDGTVAPAGNGLKITQCGACEQITDSAQKTQCKIVLGCK